MTLFLICLTLLTSCKENKYSFYIDRDNPNKTELERLFPLLYSNQEYSENRFTVMSKILTYLLIQDTPGKLNLLVTDYINENPNDPYNSYYLIILALSYINANQNDFAIPYLHRVVKNYSDLNIKGESTHFSALKTLVDISPASIDKINYYKKLIKYHSNRVDSIGELYYYLGKTYEECEMWEESIKSYEVYLEYKDTIIPSEPEARDNIIDKVGFYHSHKKWVHKDLDTLVKRIKYAISIRDPRRLDRYRAHDFFIVNWKSNSTDIEDTVPIESSKLTAMGIKVSRDLDSLSNENEAFLEVWGNPWSSNIWYVYPTWYFYFQRVNYPMDPEIHGGWEWSGIYLGEKL